MINLHSLIRRSTSYKTYFVKPRVKTISSASHVIKIVHVKPRMDMNVNRRFRMGFFPSRANAATSLSATEEASTSMLCGGFSILTLLLALTAWAFVEAPVSCDECRRSR